MAKEALRLSARRSVLEVKVCYSDALVDVRHDWVTTRKPRWVAQSLLQRPLSNVEIASVPFDCPMINTIHEQSYLQALATGKPWRLAQSAGIDWDPGFWTATLADTGLFVNGTVPAALADGVAGHLGGAFHHARYDQGAGFCSINGLVVAAATFQKTGGGKVLILDLDAHCGGGTESLLTRHSLNGVHHLDIAVSRFGFDRYEPQHGTLDQITLVDYYLPRLEHRLGELPDDFELVLYFAGMDVHHGSTPGGMDYADDALLAVREEMVFDWCQQHKLPVAFTIGGGYPGPNLSQEELVDLHRLTVLAALNSR